MDKDYLLHIPFYEVAIGNVSNWASNNAAVIVGPFDGPGTSNDLVAGELDADATNATVVTATGTIRKSNSGLTALSQAIDYNATANPDSLELSDNVSVCVGCTSGTASCTTPWASTVNHGDSVTAFEFASVVTPSTCTSSESRACSNGTLSGSFQYASCSVVIASDCVVPPWGTIADGGTVTAFLDATPLVSCTQETRTCSVGTLSGSYVFDTCAITSATCDTVVSGKKAASADIISIASDGGDTGICSSTGRNYSCSITTDTSAVNTITSNGVDLILSTTCGIQSGVNF